MINEKDVSDYKASGFPQPDPVNRPAHYLKHPSGIECIQITEHMTFTIGNAMKYLWRADYKNGLEDLKKAAWYIQREIEKREAAPSTAFEPKAESIQTLREYIQKRDKDAT